MTKIKICGLRCREDILNLNTLMPDYVGFVFAESPRRISPAEGAALRSILNPGIQTVGVFVNEDPRKLLSLCRERIVDVIQLHGDEDSDYINQIKAYTACPVIKAVRVQSKKQVAAAMELPCEYLLLDTYTRNSYGGTGKSFDLGLLPAMEKPFFLAGGLHSQNVKERINACVPYAVDVSSSVEREAGIKDEEKVAAFIRAVREAD